MDYKVIDVLRSPTIILLDTILSRRLKFMWTSNPFINFAITVIGSIASLSLFACHQRWLLLFYRFVVGLALLVASALLQIFLVAGCYKSYHTNYQHFNQSVLYSVVSSTLHADTLRVPQLDLTVKVLFFLLVQIAIHCFFTSKYMFPSTTSSPPSQSLSLLCITSSSIAILANVTEGWFNFSICLTLLPQFICLYSTLGRGVSFLCKQGRSNLQRLWRTIKEQGLPLFVETIWDHLRVPQVLRLFFIFRLCSLIAVVFTSQSLEISNENEESPQGILSYFVRMPSADIGNNSSLDNDTRTGFVNETNHTNTTQISPNFHALEFVGIMFTDSMLSVFCIGSAISVPFFYLGIELHSFVGGADLGHAQSLGSVSAVLFCLLAIQTGLTGLSPSLRLVRLYRNMCLLFAAVLHYAHDLVHPVLVTLSAQANIPMRRHIKPLFVAFFLGTAPTVFCIWLVKTKPLSTWLIALTAFSIELIVKVVATLLLYTIFAADARIEHKPWPHLDDWVFYVQSTSHSIEFVCGCVMFVNGAYVLFFESGSALRAFMMSMHAYVNIYKAACDGWKTLNNRRTVNTKLNTLIKAEHELLQQQHKDDVCSICYQNFTSEYGEVRITECKHLFHSSCLRKWLYIQDTCPMCHQAIFVAEKKTT